MHRILASTIGALLALTSCMRQQPEERVHKLLTDRIQTLATAESCTGGTIAARFTAMPGASAYFKCGVVTYSLDAKQNFVNICCDTIARYGAVSEQVVRQMAEGVRHLANAHYAIATTGIAGPTGGTPEYPVGSVWIADGVQRNKSNDAAIHGKHRQVNGQQQNDGDNRQNNGDGRL